MRALQWLRSLRKGGKEHDNYDYDDDRDDSNGSDDDDDDSASGNDRSSFDNVNNIDISDNKRNDDHFRLNANFRQMPCTSAC